MRLPEQKFSILSVGRQVFNFQFSINLLNFILLLVLICCFLSFPQNVSADFTGGINIGDHYNEFDQAVQTGAIWIYVMMQPSEAGRIADWLTRYPNINIIIRGHYPDQGGDSLTADYARAWAEKLKDLPRPVYFIPVNEPNNPSESATGVPASKVKEYTDNLIRELNNKNLLTGTTKRVILLSPSIDIFTLSDQGPQYISDLGGWSFFSQFEGICLNLYGQFDAGQIDPNAPLIKKGQGYREFLTTHFGADETSAQNTKIYACETGVMKIQDTVVKYKENAAEIKTYLETVKPIWSADKNLVMYAIFSYDPLGDKKAWIYTEPKVLQAMGLSTGITTAPPPGPETFKEQQELIEKTNEKLLPLSILQEIKTGCPPDNFKIGPLCIPKSIDELLGHKGQTTGATENFQPYMVSEVKNKAP